MLLPNIAGGKEKWTVFSVSIWSTPVPLGLSAAYTAGIEESHLSQMPGLWSISARRMPREHAQFVDIRNEEKRSHSIDL